MMLMTASLVSVESMTASLSSSAAPSAAGKTRELRIQAPIATAKGASLPNSALQIPFPILLCDQSGVTSFTRKSNQSYQKEGKRGYGAKFTWLEGGLRKGFKGLRLESDGENVEEGLKRRRFLREERLEGEDDK